jgi:hypothetical protein
MIWAVDVYTKVAHKFETREAFDNGEAAVCGAIVAVSNLVKRGKLETHIKCEKCTKGKKT